MKMRELERSTGVNRETIRVYLREGLMPQPARPKGNVADYGDVHVRAVRAIRDLKRDGKLTVPQLKRALQGDVAALPSDPAVFPHLDELLGARLGLAGGLVPAASLLKSHKEARADIRALAEIGAISPVRRKGALHLSKPDAQIVVLWGQMRAAGFDERHGFYPAILKFYVDAAASLARREVSEFLAIVAGRADENEAAEMAQAATALMLPFFGHLRTKAVVAAFRLASKARKGKRKV